VVAVVLFMAQLGLAAVAFISFIAIPMSIDNCAYEECGSEEWIAPAMWIVAISVPVGMIFTGGGIYFLAQRKPVAGLHVPGARDRGRVVHGGHPAARSPHRRKAGPIN
jgi:hypothetical protein